MTDSSKYCYDIHHTLAIDYNSSAMQAGSCCQSGRFQTDSEDTFVIWNLPELIKIRQDNAAGKNLPENFCNACIKVEQRGGRSRRQDTAAWYRDHPFQESTIRSLDIHLGNLCNLRCNICSPKNSTAWVQDAVKLKIPIHNRFKKDYNNNLNLKFSDQNILNGLEMVKFWGGEPLLMQGHIKILQQLDDLGLLKNCRILYNTNGTTLVDDDVLDLWSKARLVELYFSIDDIQQRFEHQRYGAHWDQIVNNLFWFRDSLPSNHLFYFQVTASYYNILYLDKLIEWQRAFFPSNRFGDETAICVQPAMGNCNIDRIPEKLYLEIQKNLKSEKCLESIMNYPTVGGKESATRFIRYADQLDSIRHTNWRKVHPELAEILND